MLKLILLGDKENQTIRCRFLNSTICIFKTWKLLNSLTRPRG